MEQAMEKMHTTAEGEEDVTVGALYESIETNLWLADAYFAQGEEGVALECLRAAWLEYVRFQDILRVYSGSEALGQKLMGALVERADDAAAFLALGPELEAQEGAAVKGRARRRGAAKPAALATEAAVLV